MTGVVILADWLVSQEDYLRGRQRSLDVSLARHFARSCQDAKELARTAGLVPVELTRVGFARAYGINGEPNPLQRSVMQELAQVVAAGVGSGKAGILLVTAAPGDGKSEAALEAERVLSAAFGTRGFAFLLPTMATSDQMHGRVAKALVRQGGGDGGGLTLTHSMAWLSAAYMDEELDAGEQSSSAMTPTWRARVPPGSRWQCVRASGCAERSGRCWPSTRLARSTRH